MEKNRNEENVKMIEMIKALSKKEQTAIIWAIKNIDYIKKISNNSKMSDAEINIRKKNAMFKEDYFLFILLCAVEKFNQNDNENENR